MCYKKSIGTVFNSIVDKDRNLAYYQVSLSVRDAGTLTRELRPLQNIRDHYPKYLITLDPEESVYDGIIQCNALKWLLQST